MLLSPSLVAFRASFCKLEISAHWADLSKKRNMYGTLLSRKRLVEGSPIVIVHSNLGPTNLGSTKTRRQKIKLKVTWFII